MTSAERRPTPRLSPVTEYSAGQCGVKQEKNLASVIEVTEQREPTCESIESTRSSSRFRILVLSDYEQPAQMRILKFVVHHLVVHDPVQECLPGEMESISGAGLGPLYCDMTDDVSRGCTLDVESPYPHTCYWLQVI